MHCLSKTINRKAIFVNVYPSGNMRL